jgi:hypothetical protein
MEDKVKRIEIKEFREKGYLQELNRRFLHPLGLALEIILNDDGTEKLGGVWDYREEKEGIYYDISNADLERKTRFNEKKLFIDTELENRCKNRKEILGFDVEPLD